MEDFTKPNSCGKNSYRGLDHEASFKRGSVLSTDSLDFGAQSNPLLQDSSAPSMLNQITTTQPTTQEHNQQANISLDDKAAKNRQRNREYRQRCNKEKMEMKENLKAFGGENEHLKRENESLKRENVSMNQISESQAEKMQKLKHNLKHMKSKYEKQNVLVHVLSSSLLANPDLQLENRKLKDENNILRKNVEMIDYSSVQLIKEISKLQHENRVLRLQIDALCGKIVDNR